MSAPFKDALLILCAVAQCVAFTLAVAGDYGRAYGCMTFAMLIIVTYVMDDMGRPQP